MINFHEYTSLVTHKSMRRRTMVACMVMVFQQWCGINAINYYAPFIFRGINLQGDTVSLLATGVVGILEFVFTIPAVLWVDYFGRKTILIIGGIGMASCIFCIAGITGAYSGHFANQVGAGWAAVVLVWLYVANFAYSWGPIAWIIVSEVFPLSIRAKGVSIDGSSNWLNNFGVGLATSPFVHALEYGAFIFFGCIMICGVLFIYFIVLETKGRSLEEMDELFGLSGVGVRDEDCKRKIEREIFL